MMFSIMFLRFQESPASKLYKATVKQFLTNCEHPCVIPPPFSRAFCLLPGIFDVYQPQYLPQLSSDQDLLINLSALSVRVLFAYFPCILPFSPCSSSVGPRWFLVQKCRPQRKPSSCFTNANSPNHLRLYVLTQGRTAYFHRP